MSYTGRVCVKVLFLTFAFGKRRTSASSLIDESRRSLVSSDERERTAEAKVQMKGNRARVGISRGGVAWHGPPPRGPGGGA